MQRPLTVFANPRKQSAVAGGHSRSSLSFNSSAIGRSPRIQDKRTEKQNNNIVETLITLCLDVTAAVAQPEQFPRGAGGRNVRVVSEDFDNEILSDVKDVKRGVTRVFTSSYAVD